MKKNFKLSQTIRWGKRMEYLYLLSQKMIQYKHFLKLSVNKPLNK